MRIRDKKYNPQYMPNVIDLLGLNKQVVKKQWFIANPFALYHCLSAE